MAATDPMAEGKASGVAFEERIAEVFRYMGFDAARIGGAGNTDVIVRWKKMMKGRLLLRSLMANRSQQGQLRTVT